MTIEAIAVSEYGASEVLQFIDRPDPHPGKGGARITGQRHFDLNDPRHVVREFGLVVVRVADDKSRRRNWQFRQARTSRARLKS